jgi:hypothetical protein
MLSIRVILKIARYHKFLKKHLDYLFLNGNFPELHSFDIILPASGIIYYHIIVVSAKKLTIHKL